MCPGSMRGSSRANHRGQSSVFKNIGSNWVVTLVTVAARYVLTPSTIHKLGDQAYGTWMLITAMTGYVSLLALGVPMAAVRSFAQHVAVGDEKKLSEAIGGCMALYLLLGAIALVVGTGLYVFFSFYNIPEPLSTDAHWAFVLMVVFVSIGFVGLLPEGVLASHDDFVPRNIVRLSALLLRVVLTVVLLSLSASLAVLALVQIACLMFDFVLCWVFIRRRYPNIRVRLRDFDWAMARGIFSFSLFVLVLNAGARLSFETDALVIGAFKDVGSIPYFTVANSFLIYLMEFIIAIAAVVMPIATRLKTQNKTAELRGVFLKWSKIALSLSLMVGLFLIVLGPRFIAWWIDPAFEAPAGEVLQILMVSYLVFLPMRGVALPILMGLGKPGLPTIGFLVAGVLNLVLSIALIGRFGLAGVALGTAIPNVLFGALVVVQTCRELETPVRAYLRYVVPRAVLGALPVLGVLLWFKLGLDVRSIGQLVAAGVAMVAVFGAIWVVFVYRDDPYVDLRRYLPGLRVSQKERA